MLLALPLAGWPVVAKEWITRKRKWPNEDQVHHLLELPCHLIPKPVMDDDKDYWRFSFSRQELYLATILPFKARLAYVGLKYILKKYLKKISKKLKSYHMLTAFLWFMEETGNLMWEDEKVNNFEEHGSTPTPGIPLIQEVTVDGSRCSNAGGTRKSSGK